ncbi:MAG: purine-cytosine permease family protein [Streptosporangiales bacterium]
MDTDERDDHSVSMHSVEQVLQPIPEAARTTRVGGQFWIWAGANIAPINWVLGALGIEFGLGLLDTVLVIAVGNLIGMSIFGLFVLMGQRTGVTGMVLSRAAFGRRGNYLPAVIQAALVMGWCAVNTWIVLDLVMALLGKLGAVDPAQPNTGWRILVAAVIMAVQVVISWLGYRAIAAFERWTVPVTVLILIVMSVVAWGTLDIDWGYAGPPGHVLAGPQKWAAMTAVMTIIGIGWGITWFTYAADYSRFVSRRVPPAKLYLVSAFGQFLPVVWLGILGASLATYSGEIDPGKLVVDSFGALAIPVLFLVIHGPIATNVLNVYTFSVATQALDLKIKRRHLSVIVGVVSMACVVGFIFRQDLASTLDAFLGSVVAWIATWGGIMLVHYYGIARRKIDPERLFEPVGTSRLPDINWAAIIAFFVGIFATWLFMYGGLPVFQGFAAKALGGVDLSWLAGGLTAGGIYALLGPRVERAYTAAVPGVQPAGERT